MEEYVKHLLEISDFRVLTRKMIREKYKLHIGRELTPEQKQSINKLVDALLYEYASKKCPEELVRPKEVVTKEKENQPDNTPVLPKKVSLGEKITNSPRRSPRVVLTPLAPSSPTIKEATDKSLPSSSRLKEVQIKKCSKALDLKQTSNLTNTKISTKQSKEKISDKPKTLPGTHVHRRTISVSSKKTVTVSPKNRKVSPKKRRASVSPRMKFSDVISAVLESGSEGSDLEDSDSSSGSSVTMATDKRNSNNGSLRSEDSLVQSKVSISRKRKRTKEDDTTEIGIRIRCKKQKVGANNHDNENVQETKSCLKPATESDRTTLTKSETNRFVINKQMERLESDSEADSVILISDVDDLPKFGMEEQIKKGKTCVDTHKTKRLEFEAQRKKKIDMMITDSDLEESSNDRVKPQKGVSKQEKGKGYLEGQKKNPKMEIVITDSDLEENSNSGVKVWKDEKSVNMQQIKRRDLKDQRNKKSKTELPITDSELEGSSDSELMTNTFVETKETKDTQQTKAPDLESPKKRKSRIKVLLTDNELEESSDSELMTNNFVSSARNDGVNSEAGSDIEVSGMDLKGGQKSGTDDGKFKQLTQDTNSPIGKLGQKRKLQHIMSETDSDAESSLGRISDIDANFSDSECIPLAKLKSHRTPTKALWALYYLQKLGKRRKSGDKTSKSEVVKRQVKRKSPASAPDEHPHLKQLKKICHAVGIIIRNTRELKGCETDNQKIKRLKEILNDAGMKGQPSMRKVEEFKLKREAAELDSENIIPKSAGRERRTVRSWYKSSACPSPSPHKSPAPSHFARLKGIVDSEQSEEES